MKQWDLKMNRKDRISVVTTHTVFLQITPDLASVARVEHGTNISKNKNFPP